MINKNNNSYKKKIKISYKIKTNWIKTAHRIKYLIIIKERKITVKQTYKSIIPSSLSKIQMKSMRAKSKWKKKKTQTKIILHTKFMKLWLK